MTQKEQITELLFQTPEMTQTELAYAIYHDKKHTPYIYASLMALVKEGKVLRIGQQPAYYSLSAAGVQRLKATTAVPQKASSSPLYEAITPDAIEEVERSVLSSQNYGQEIKLITDCLSVFPKNKDVNIVAMKIGLIDITNSTHISQYKSKISIVELANHIVDIPDIDKRIASGDPSVVNEIARTNGKINLFSFASKYCCYHNHNYYKKDDYSIYDSILIEYLPLYFGDITTYKLKTWKDNFKYECYNEYITRKLNELNIQIPDRKRKFDHYIWFKNR